MHARPRLAPNVLGYLAAFLKHLPISLSVSFTTLADKMMSKFVLLLTLCVESVKINDPIPEEAMESRKYDISFTLFVFGDHEQILTFHKRSLSIPLVIIFVSSVPSFIGHIRA